MSHFPPSKANKATCEPTINWSLMKMLSREGKKTNENVYLSLREDISGVEGT